MSVVNYVRDNLGIPLALVVKGNDPNLCTDNSTNFLSNPKDPLQFGIIRRYCGSVIQAHTHHTIPEPFDGSQSKPTLITEALIVLSGKVVVSIYGGDWNIQHEVLEAGDVIVFLSGGHKLEFLEDSVIYEVRTGPYNGPDKVLIEPNNVYGRL